MQFEKQRNDEIPNIMSPLKFIYLIKNDVCYVDAAKVFVYSIEWAINNSKTAVFIKLRVKEPCNACSSRRIPCLTLFRTSCVGGAKEFDHGPTRAKIHLNLQEY